MMKNRFIKYTLFVLLVLTVDQLAGSFIAHFAQKQVRDNRIELLLNKEIKSDIIILGSSRALNNYSPDIISDLTGKTCYNLGVSGSNILFHETMLDLIIGYGYKPKMIIYNIDDYGALYKMDGIVYRKDVLYPYVDNSTVHWHICRENNKKEIASMLMKTYRQNVNFINALKYFVYGREAIDYKTTNFDITGANLLIQRAEDRTPVFGTIEPPQLPSEPDSLHAVAFKRIQQKCIDNNIELIITLPPLFIKDTPGFKGVLQSQINKRIRFIDLTGQMQDAKFFFNKDHMNKEGAKVFSRMVAEQLKTPEN